MPAPKKEGLTTALEFTKFVITLDTALIAFVTGATFLEHIGTLPAKIAVIIILLVLAISIVAGILVYMRISTMLSEGKYDLGDSHLRTPGAWNVLCFGAGSGGVAILAVLQIVLVRPEPQASQQLVTVRCATGLPQGQITHCRGQIISPPNL